MRHNFIVNAHLENVVDVATLSVSARLSSTDGGVTVTTKVVQMVQQHCLV